MNKIIGIALVAGIVLIGGGYWYLSMEKSEKEAMMMEEKMAAEKSAMAAKEAMMKKESPAAMDNTAMMAKGSDPMAKPEDAMMKKDDAMMMAKPMESAMMGGQYAAYDASKVAFAKEGKVVLFFRASWCPTCRALDADIKANLSMIPKDMLILDVDYDKSAEMKKQYGVTYQHTLVQVDADGKQLAKWSGSAGLKELLAQVK